MNQPGNSLLTRTLWKLLFKEVFPESNFLPKHHFLEHYPQLICEFRPLVALWTMRFEAKHSFFKRVVWHTTCFKNVLLSLAQRHLFLMARHLHMWSFPKSPLEVANVSSLPIDVLKEDIAFALKQRHPELDGVCLAKNATYSGLNHRNGMILAHGSLAGLPEFVEIIQMIVVKDNLLFIVRKLSAWYWEQSLWTEYMSYKEGGTGQPKSTGRSIPIGWLHNWGKAADNSQKIHTRVRSVLKWIYQNIQVINLKVPYCTYFRSIFYPWIPLEYISIIHSCWSLLSQKMGGHRHLCWFLEFLNRTI